MTPSASLLGAPAVVREALRGEHGSGGLRSILRQPHRHGATELSTPPDGPDLQLLRSKFKPGRNLRAYYRRPGVTDDAVGTYWAVTWSLSSDDADPAVQCLAYPHDPAMPQLQHLSQVEHVVALTESLTGERLAPPRAARVDPVRYRPGQRHVLGARIHDPPIYLKVDRDRSGAHAAPVAEVVQAVLRSSCPQVRAATPLGYSATTSASLWWGEEGELLSRRLVARSPGGPVTVRLLSSALRTMHDRVTPGTDGASRVRRVHEASEEAAAVLRAGEHVAALLPGIWPLYRELVARTTTRLRDLPPVGGPRFAHGDFKSENVLVLAGRPRILDFDRACVAEPAMDLGKLLADLTWWCAHDPAYLRTVHSALQAGYAAPEPALWARAELWSALFHLKFAARRCPLHEHDWSARVAEQVERARRVLTGAGAAR